MKNIIISFLLFCSLSGFAQADYFDLERRAEWIDNTFRTTAADTFITGVAVVKIGSTYHAYITKFENDDGINGYAYYAKLYHASASDPRGPFNTMTHIDLSGQTWCAGSQTNGWVIVVGDKVYLYFTGTTSETPSYPVVGTPARNNQQIGVAVADVSTPDDFTLYTGNPILSPVSSTWNELFVNNPAVYAGRHGGFMMAYKSATIAAPNTLEVGIAHSWHPLGPWTNAPASIGVSDMEDPAVWWEGEFYYIITSNTAAGGGLMFYSKDGVSSWTQVTDAAKSWRLATVNNNYTSNVRSRVERPFILVEDGKAKCFYRFVMAQGDTTTTFNIGQLIRQ